MDASNYTTGVRGSLQFHQSFSIDTRTRIDGSNLGVIKSKVKTNHPKRLLTGLAHEICVKFPEVSTSGDLEIIETSCT